MTYFAAVLTFILVINCLLLILLILVQLPKKDAGAGLAFGGGTADALFGAGSGNALTKITKWATVVFLLLALFLGYLQDKSHNPNSAAEFAKKVQEKQQQAPAATANPAAQPAAQMAPPVTSSTTPTPTIPAAISGAAAAATNSAK